MKHDDATLLATALLDLRSRRAEHLPAILFGEPAWGLLLTMFIADAKGASLTASEACRLAGGPSSVSHRWLMVLREQGLIDCDQRCDGSHLVVLSPKAVSAIEACMFDAMLLLRV